MTVIQKSTWVPYKPSQMYDLVDDIEKYPEFLPWCSKTIVHSRDKDEVRATIQFAKGGFHHSFSTINRLQKNKMIEVRLLEGPFRKLEGFWHFYELESGGCRVSLDLEFILSNRLLDLTVGPILQSITSNFVEAFGKRAEQLYDGKQ
jgi:ribosome-associated toxin RatA of RatAB toxin-antitoxin module